MAQLAAATRLSSLRATPGLRERVDLPRRMVFIAASSMVAVVALLLVFITWQGLQLFLVNGVPVDQILSSTWQPDPANGQVIFGLLPFIAGTVFVMAGDPSTADLYRIDLG